MTDEFDLDDMDSWDFPEEYVENLEDLDTGSPHFSVVQGRLYDNMRTDVRYSATEAMEVSRALNRGELDEAFDIIYDGIEGEEL